MLLVAKQCIMANWLNSSAPMVVMVVTQLRHFPLSNKREAKQCGNVRAKMFLKKCKTFILKQLSREEIVEFLKAFRYTELYDLKRLRGFMGCSIWPMRGVLIQSHQLYFSGGYPYSHLGGRKGDKCFTPIYMWLCPLMPIPKTSYLLSLVFFVCYLVVMTVLIAFVFRHGLRI